MKYALFVLALLLVLFGCFAVYSGSQAIEVERGWSILIAGTITAVGGVLLFGVAWIVRTLEQIRATLQKAGVEAMVAPGLKLGTETRPEPVEAERQGLRPQTAPAPAAAVAWPPHTSPAAPEHEGEESAAQEFEMEPAEETREFAEYASFEAEANAILTAPFTEETARPAARAASASNKASSNVRDFWRRAGKEPNRASPSARSFVKTRPEAPAQTFAQPKAVPPLRPIPQPSEDEPAFEPAPAPAGAHDWIERTLPNRETRESEQVEVGDELGEELEAFNENAEREPPPPPLVGEPPAAEAITDEPAVIGRYDAEGTCYTMFADGSIEAQSERGVFRFKSMEELKAYFETLREPQ